MRTVKIASAALLLVAVPAFAKIHPKKSAPSKTTSSAIRHASAPAASAKKVAVVRHESAPGMAPERATAIQAALIKAGYMSGEPSGSWDSESAAAMQKFQGDNDWQTKFTPDARALNKLGLGGAAVSSDVAQ